MKSFWRRTAVVVLILGLLLIAAVVTVVANLADIAMSPDMTITVDDETIHFGGFSGTGWLLAVGGVLLAVVILLVVVVPLLLLFGLGVPLLACAGAVVLTLLLAGAALLAAASPFIALALVIVWLMRAKRPRRTEPPQPLRTSTRLQPDLPSGA